MSISEAMQGRLNKIDNILSENYELKRVGQLAIPKLTNNQGKQVRLFFGGPAGFSWAGFFWSSILMFKIKEYSFYLIISIVSVISEVIKLATNSLLFSSLFLWLVLIAYGFYFPYLRSLSKADGKKEHGMLKSIILGTILYYVALIPSIIISTTGGIQ